MSILIRGMKMPHDCDECRLCAFIPVGDYGINRKCLPLINAKAEITIRRADCPLVPVPSHGRLIDADAAAKQGWTINRTYSASPTDMVYEVKTMTDEVLPTIIPADDKESGK